MERNELIKIFLENIEKERVALRLTQQQMAQKLGMSLSGYKKMIAGETAKIDMVLVHRLYELTGQFMCEMVGMSVPEVKLIRKYQKLSPSQQKFVEDIIDFEEAFRPEDCGEDYITLMVPMGNLEDGMIWDSVDLQKVNISAYRSRFGADLHCAIKVTTNHLHPVYHDGDVLLMCRRAPRDGDIGIFINKNTGRAYLRRFKQTVPCQLLPINGYGETFYVDPYSVGDMEQWIKFGVVLTKLR